ncbi:MAG: hypothetical protein K2X48_19760 [Chitinophagaceae bacterium]|nr:hypothetical protein [Chitinophagaceae bacterium]
MKAINITAYTEDESQIEALKAVIKAFKIKYSVSKTKTPVSIYKPDFVAMIRKGEADLKKGKGIKMTMAELEKLCK